MGRRLKFLFLVMIAGTMLSACANQWREGDPQRSSTEVGSFLKDLEGFSGGDANLQAAIAMAKDPYTRVYFAEANGVQEKQAAQGPIHAVTPVQFEILDPLVSMSTVSNVKTYYLDRLLADGGGHEGALVFEMTVRGSNQKIVRAFYRDASSGKELGNIQDGSFMMTLDGNLNSAKAQPGIVVMSQDVQDDDLQIVIQLELYYTDLANEVWSMGKLSTLAGYGN